MGNETHQIDNSRYIEDQKKQNPLLNVDIDYKKLSTNENPMFEVYKKLAIYSNVDLGSVDQDLKLFKKLKDIIIKAGFILVRLQMYLVNFTISCDSLQYRLMLSFKENIPVNLL